MVPMDVWLTGFRDSRAYHRVLLRLDRLEMGIEGQWRSLGGGVRELKISAGPGYRVYYAWHGERTVVLLCGGDKRSQRTDIKKAMTYWNDYRKNQ